MKIVLETGRLPNIVQEFLGWIESKEYVSDT